MIPYPYLLTQRNTFTRFIYRDDFLSKTVASNILLM